jgi:endoglycosylceramidase
MTLLRLATLFALLVSVAVCGPAGRIRVSGGSLVDSQNRTRILHGVNVVYKLAPYYPPQGSFDPYYSLTEKDLDILVSLGVTAVRLGVMWPGVEPEAGQYNMTYLGVIREIVDALAARGIYSLLDVHQDVATSFACGEGVPRWASEILMQGLEMPFPFPLPIKFDRDPATGYPNMTQCLEHPFAAYYVTDTVGWVFDGLWKNRGGVLDAFARMWQQVATSFRGVKGVLGYELINEP